MLISNGVGVSLLPIRIGARPQVIHLTLRRGEKGGRTVSETEARAWIVTRRTVRDRQADSGVKRGNK